jgi:predicted nucleotidyltransferase
LTIDPAAREWLKGIPERFQEVIQGVTTEMLERFPDVRGTVVVGSVAEGDYDEYSDVDYLYVREPMIPNPEIVEIKSRFPLAHFIYHSPQALQKHFADCDVMAWSIKRGVVIMDPDRLLAPLRARPLDAPRREWLRQRVELVRGWPDDARGSRTKMINFGILYLSLSGTVPTTKRKLRDAFLAAVTDPLLVEAMKIATQRGRTHEDYAADELQVLKESNARLHDMIRGF